MGGCIVGSIDREGLHHRLNLPGFLDILLVLALGTPGETVVLEDGRSLEAVPDWRDPQGAHHVPKRSLVEVLVQV